MSPEYVQPYVKAQKTDDRDAEAIAEAATRPTMRLVTLKSEAQLDLQVLHRRPALLDHTDELVAEGVPDPGVRHQPVVEVQVRPADRGEGHPDDRVVGVLDAWSVLLLDPDLVRPSVGHRAHSVSPGRNNCVRRGSSCPVRPGPTHAAACPYDVGVRRRRGGSRLGPCRTCSTRSAPTS